MDTPQLSRTAIGSVSRIRPLEKNSGDNNFVEEIIYREQIPEFVAATLIRLYDNVFCTLHRVEVYETLQGIHTYVKRIDSVIQAVILFRVQETKIVVVNQQVSFKTEELNQFAKKVFAEYRQAEVISFYALDIALPAFAFPFQCRDVLEENVIYFPPTVDDYIKSLKGQFRKQLRIFNEQMLANYPTYAIKIFSRKEIQAEHIQAVVGFARSRMLLKGKDDYTRRLDVPVLTKMLRACGYMAVAMVDDKICGGAMWFSVGRRHFHQLAAHDAQYDRYMLGNQIWLAAISHSLRLGGSECWLMGGSSAHKARFGAHRKVFCSCLLYRSNLHIVLNLPLYTSMWAKERLCSTKTVIKDMSTKPTPAGRCIKKGLLILGMVQAGLHHAFHDS